MDTETGCTSNWVSSSAKPVGSMDLSLVYDESISSHHTGNVSLSGELGIIGLAPELESDEKHKLNQSGYQIPDTIPVEESQDSESDDEDDELGDDLKEILQDDSSNNSMSSFTFPILLHNVDGSVKTPTMETRWNVFDRWLQLPQPQTQPQLQLQFYFIPAAATHTLTRLPPHRESPSLKQTSEMQAQKAFRNRWFSCFICPCQHD
ncbi:unnamed protein product [Microthlaspi erraticum]|uniref:Uncharacterized protein n=1 Tax=Microthlaspi erraticum TaxID=1685480 RepID=A0A6D2ILV7_9BRAS|nr:unnamed protein product [Microthlaspi erraticum]